MKSSRHKFELGYVDKLRMLRTRVYWGPRLEAVDPNVTSTAMCQGECELAKESELRESSYVFDSPRSLLRQVRILGPNTLSCALNILKQSSPQFRHKFHHKFRHHFKSSSFHHYLRHQLPFTSFVRPAKQALALATEPQAKREVRSILCHTRQQSGNNVRAGREGRHCTLSWRGVTSANRFHLRMRTVLFSEHVCQPHYPMIVTLNILVHTYNINMQREILLHLRQSKQQLVEVVPHPWPARPVAVKKIRWVCINDYINIA